MQRPLPNYESASQLSRDSMRGP